MVSLMRLVSFLKFGSLSWLFKSDDRILYKFYYCENRAVSHVFLLANLRLKLVFSLAVARLALVFLVIKFVLYFNILACVKGLKGSVLTNSSRGIQHVRHFWYAVVLVLKCNAEAQSLRASPLNWALCAFEEN